MADPIAELTSAVQFAGMEATNVGLRDAMRTQTDFIGRMNDCFAEIDEHYDEETETFPEGEAKDEAIDSLIGLAGLCIGLVAMLRTPEPEEPT